MSGGIEFGLSSLWVGGAVSRFVITHVSHQVGFLSTYEGYAGHSRNRLSKHLRVSSLEAEPEMEYLCKAFINGLLW